MNCDIKQEHIQKLLGNFAKTMYKAKESDEGSLSQDVVDRCTEIVKMDYSVVEIDNRLGELSAHYPSVIVIPEYEHRIGNSYNNGYSSMATSTASSQTTRPQQTIYENLHDASKLRKVFKDSRIARCRSRFPIPVILYKGKYICRSGTLSSGPEIYARHSVDLLFSGEEPAAPNLTDANEACEAQESLSEETLQDVLKQRGNDWALIDSVRSGDIKLLKTLNVGTIVDFMVEKKKVKFGLNVTSSEKVDKENRYSDFTIVSLPYPGCEFFREYRDNQYSAEGLIFDWTLPHVDAELDVPVDSISSQLNITWKNYKDWDLVTITQNYLKLLLKYLQDSSSGLLLHCISGWDRTPLFVSLLRLSLWADGAIHQSLSALQILYFTIAYDWYLFGHNMPDRLNKGEEIFSFCFYVLKFLMEDEFSVIGHRYKSKHSSGSSSIGVLRTDSECMLDGVMFDDNHHASNQSLNSSSSGLSAKSQHDSNHHHHNYSDESVNGNATFAGSHCLDGAHNMNNCASNDAAWSPQPKRTSPVTVPISCKQPRQRQESSSSLSVGSWQMISGTGSLRSTDSNTVCSGHTNNINLTKLSTANANQISQDSASTILDDDCFSLHCNEMSRRERLNAVRSLFYQCYCSTISFKNGPDSALVALFGNFAERVGLAQRTSV